MLCAHVRETSRLKTFAWEAIAGERMLNFVLGMLPLPSIIKAATYEYGPALMVAGALHA